MSANHSPTPTLDDALISVQEAANRCHVHYRTMRRWLAEGRINGVRVGPRLIKVNPRDLVNLVSPVGGGAR